MNYEVLPYETFSSLLLLPSAQVHLLLKYHQSFLPLFDTISTKKYYRICGLGSVTGTGTGYELDDPGIESRWRQDFSAPVQTGPGAHPSSCTMGTGSFPGVKSGRGVTLTPHLLLMPWSWKSRAIPLLPLWAVQPVQSLSACTRVTFTTFFVTGFIWM